MGSTFTTFPDKYDQTSLFGTKQKLPIYLQFVPGIVIDVVNAADSGGHEGVRERIGSIKALPHIGVTGVKKGTMLPEKHRYYPLMRGMQEIPVKGDPVLLCTIGDRNYYLGPLNTEGEPNFNDDQYGLDQAQALTQLTGNEVQGTTPLFIRKPVTRLQKPRNNFLDNPLAPHGMIDDQIAGDMVFEGRHGNSLRIGSRNINPYMIFSNGRSFSNSVESSLDGTIFSMTKQGTLRQHFNHDKKLKNDAITGTNPDKPENTEMDNQVKYDFRLADGEYNRSNLFRSIETTAGTSLARGLGPHKSEYSGTPPENTGEHDKNILSTIYGYNKNQAFLSSDRITFNARKESMFLSSKKFLHMGAGNTFTLSANNTCLFTAGGRFRIENTPLVELFSTGKIYLDGRDKIVLGRPSKQDYVEPAVMGYSLSIFLATIINTIQELSNVTASAIEQRKKSGAATKLLKEYSDTLNTLMGKEEKTLPDGKKVDFPFSIGNLIMSKKVRIKK